MKLPDLIDKAVIDVGSNSVRLVIYRTSDTFFQPIFNEKATAALGKGVSETGKLNRRGVRIASQALARYARIIEARNITPDRIHAVATAAVRDASDGQAFLLRIKKRTGLDVTVISGKEEARLSALGAVAGEPESDGIMADLGGSSLELVHLADGRPGDGMTYRLGPLAVNAIGSFDQDKISQHAADVLEKGNASRFALADNKSLIAVGGAWRAMAKVHMALQGYPLHIVHNYRMAEKDARNLARLVRQQRPASLAQIPDVSARRAQSLPYAAMLLEQLLDITGASHVVISAFGLREGLLQDDLTHRQTEIHPVLASVTAMAQQNWSSPAFGKSMSKWMGPVYAHLGQPFGATRTPVLEKAVGLIGNIGVRMHPDHRAEIAFDLVLHAPYAGLDHSERAALALAIFHRYAGPATPPRATLLMRVLNEEKRVWALAAGLGLRCAAAVSGRTSLLLERTALRIEDGCLTLDAHEEEIALLTSSPERRLRDLADALGLTSQLLT